MRKKIRFFACFTVLFVLNSAWAQNAFHNGQDSKLWHFRTEPYLMFPNMSGQTGVRGLPLADVDASPSDIFSRLQIGAMLNMEATNGNWSVISDILYMDLEQEITPSALVSSGTLGMRQFALELAGLKRFTPWLELGIGAIVNNIAADQRITRKQVGGGSITQEGSMSKTWVDPMLIVRIATPSSPKKWIGQGRGEIGGFGIGSDFTWQVQAMAGYRFSKLFDMTIGYRVIGIDYASGNDSKAFIYDMTIFGPMIRFGFTF